MYLIVGVIVIVMLVVVEGSLWFSVIMCVGWVFCVGNVFDFFIVVRRWVRWYEIVVWEGVICRLCSCGGCSGLDFMCVVVFRVVWWKFVVEVWEV